MAQIANFFANLMQRDPQQPNVDFAAPGTAPQPVPSGPEYWKGMQWQRPPQPVQQPVPSGPEFWKGMQWQRPAQQPKPRPPIGNAGPAPDMRGNGGWGVGGGGFGGSPGISEAQTAGGSGNYMSNVGVVR